ncbi:MAG TPA: tryptophan synthase subunit alpha [Longimicrobiales bacterium]
MSRRDRPTGCDAIAAAFAGAAAERRAALIPFLAAGDPSPDAGVDIALAAAHAGADLLELGLPYADSLADGPTIRAAYERALAAGTSTDAVLRCASRIGARCGTPLVLMSAYNPILARRTDRFVAAAAEAGVAALLVPDLPVEDSTPLAETCARAGIALALLVGPDTDDARATRIARAASGFVYVVRRRGVTGAGGAGASVPERVARLRATGAPPIAVGFGIATPADAAREARHADGVIVGSALVDQVARALERRADPAGAVATAVADFARALRVPATATIDPQDAA